MTRRIFIGLACLALMSGLARADLLWGVNGHPASAYPGVSIDQQLDYVRDMGMTSYRVNISRASDIATLAMLVEQGKERGITILPVITPALDLDSETAEDLYSKSYDLAVALVSRFKDDIRVWELGNELENYAIITACEMQDDGIQYNCSWGPAGGTGRTHYFGPRWEKASAVLRGLSEGTMSVDPTVRKAMGTAGWGHTGAFERMLEDGLQWDISIWHYYEGDPKGAFEYLATLGRPIWVTEFNHSGGSLNGEQAQAQGLLQMMKLLRRYQHVYDVEAAHVYELLDEPYWAPSYEAVMGLVEMKKTGDNLWAPTREKLAYQAIRDFIANAPDIDLPAGSSKTKPPAAQARSDRVAPSAGAPRACAPEAIDTSVVNAANQVVYSYCLMLHRLPTPKEQWRYVLAMKQDPSVLPMLTDLQGSDAFRDAGTLAASDVEYVTGLYRLLLGREPDGGGLSSYVAQLKTGATSREALASELIRSHEFKTKHAILFSDALGKQAPQ